MKEKMIESSGIMICTESFGNHNNPTVLLIMGATSSLVWWEEEFCEQLAGKGLHVIRYDNRDVGRSITYTPGNPRYSFEDLADDAINILDAYGVEKAHIVGMSMGGLITQIIALRHPRRVLSISLIMTSNFDRSLPQRGNNLADFFSKNVIVDWSDEDQVVNYIVNRYKTLLGSKNKFDEEKIKKLVTMEVNRANNLPSMDNHSLIKGGGSYLARIKDIRVPTLVIHGTEDPIIPYEHGLFLSKTIPGAVLITLEGTGHEIQSDRDTVIEAISKHIISN
jgi:pimeloyl-ACP methyl ester carboxylesterase